tara:strand:- start:2248 stop:2904 length:657 start_codon:yes stop_codon:yes gene_type:complete
MTLPNLNKLKPRKFLSLGRHSLAHVGDLSKPYFVVVGCSYTYGVGLNYKDVWCNKLAQTLGLEHINLSFPGTSIEYQYDKILQTEKILSDAKFIIWMQSSPVRSHRTFLSFLIGDKSARIPVSTTWGDKKLWEKVQRFYDLTKNKKIIFTNGWHWNNKIKLLLENKICKQNKNYFLNKYEPEDLGFDKIHPGTQSHLHLVNDIGSHITKHFSDWIGNK